jgi:Holliday junction DNA helicase RuvA
MIHAISGILKNSIDNLLIIDVSGIGYGVQVPKPQLFQVDQKINLLIHTHFNSEQGPSLFGFQSILEKTIFLMIIDCSGVGPRLGMAILAQMSPQEFIEAIQSANEKALSSISGIGAKKAEHIIVHLKHKVAKLIDSGIEINTMPALEKRHEISQVLKSLNYSKMEIALAMSYINEKYPGNIAFDQLMRHALAYLAKQI